jgi:hypothetical protein
MEHIKPQVTHFSPEPIHEDKDIDVKAVLGFGIFLAVCGAIIHVAMWGFYVGLGHWADKRDEATANPMTSGPAVSGAPKPVALRPESVQRQMKDIVATFPEPRLQPDEVRDMDLFRQSEDKKLRSYGKVDASGQTIHIPIERAMEIVAERGLPNFGTAPAGPATRPQGQTLAQPGQGSATVPATADTTTKKK